MIKKILRPRPIDTSWNAAELSLRAGFPVVVSGSFEQPDDRERFRRLAESHGLLFGILTIEDSAREAQLDEEELASTHVYASMIQSE